MGREGRLRNNILILITTLLALYGCVKSPINNSLSKDYQEITIQICNGNFASKSSSPEENKITDISLMIFDEYGSLEQYRWIPYTEIQNVLENGIKIHLAADKIYHFCGCVNFGYRVYAQNLTDIDKINYHLVYPDDFRQGIPMCIEEHNVRVKPNTPTIVLNIKRLMAKISLRIDRSHLSDDVKMNVINARIGNCPKYVKVFGQSRINDESGKFASGFSKNEFETANLNKYEEDKISCKR